MIKRAVDMCGAGFALIVTVPGLASVALAISLRPRPDIQMRIRQAGWLIQVYKLRALPES